MRHWRWLGLFSMAAGVASACDRPEYSYSDTVPVAGSTPTFGGSGFAGSATGSGAAPVDQCHLYGTVGAVPIFKPQAISNQLPAQAELYLQVTDAEAQALRQGAPLIGPAPDAMTPSPLTNRLTYLAQTLFNPDRKALVTELLSRFKITRAAWPNPWAQRLLDHPATEHMNPVRLRLSPDAWIARLIDDSPIVLDLKNSEVPLVDALQHPERIAAVYYLMDGTQAGVGPGTACESDKREFVLGNVNMLESFELGTAEIASRLSADVDALQRLFTAARLCTSFDSPSGMTFHASTVCQAWDFFDATTEFQAYQWALSNPVELYKPSPQNLASLIQALQDDEFAPNPFVSTPEQVGAGGGGNGLGGAPSFGGAESAGEAGFGQGGR